MIINLDTKDSLEQSDIEECKKIVEDYAKSKDPSIKIVLSKDIAI